MFRAPEKNSELYCSCTLQMTNSRKYLECLIQRLSPSQLERHYFIQQLASLLTQTISCDGRQCSAQHLCNLLWVRVHEFQYNVKVKDAIEQAMKAHGGVEVSFFNLLAIWQWVVNAIPQPHPRGKDSVSIVQVASWAPGLVFYYNVLLWILCIYSSCLKKALETFFFDL